MMFLHYENGSIAPIEITKDGKKWCYFTAIRTGIKYRVEKATGVVQVAPYWKTLKGLYVEVKEA